MTEDTLDIVLLQWMMEDRTLSLRRNPHFYLRVALPTISSICRPLAFSNRLRTTLGETRPMIIHCLMDSYDHPLIIFKQVPGWAFGRLCRFDGRHGKLVLKSLSASAIYCLVADISSATTGDLRDERWYQKQLSNPGDSINFTVMELGAGSSTRPDSLTWVKMLREIEKDPIEHTMWVIETPSNKLLVCVVFRTLMLS